MIKNSKANCSANNTHHAHLLAALQGTAVNTLCSTKDLHSSKTKNSHLTALVASDAPPMATDGASVEPKPGQPCKAAVCSILVHFAGCSLAGTTFGSGAVCGLAGAGIWEQDFSGVRLHSAQEIALSQAHTHFGIHISIPAQTGFVCLQDWPSAGGGETLGLPGSFSSVDAGTQGSSLADTIELAHRDSDLATVRIQWTPAGTAVPVGTLEPWYPWYEPGRLPRSHRCSPLTCSLQTSSHPAHYPIFSRLLRTSSWLYTTQCNNPGHQLPIVVGNVGLMTRRIS